MATTGHLFEDMMATYNRLDIAGRVAGKSSYTQRAFRRLRRVRKQGDLSSVFTTVGDAGTLWHLQFFKAATLESHPLIEEERSSRMTSALCS